MSQMQPATTPNTPLPPLPDNLQAEAAKVRALYEQTVYGRFPASQAVDVLRHQTDARDAYTLHQIEIRIGQARQSIAVFVPAQTPPNAVLLGPNFYSNHTVHTDKAIWLQDQWIPQFIPEVIDNRGSEALRGRSRQVWEIERAMARGVVVATFYYGDLWPDRPDGHEDPTARPFADRSAPDATGALAAWAWGLHRAHDAINQALPDLATLPTFVWGHSRLGKAALLAAAFDESRRFAGAISNQSGSGGAALFRGKQGEHVRESVNAFHYWYAPRYRDYVDRDHELPLDQHWLIGLIAPRPVLICSAENDLWADPARERDAVLAARPAWSAVGADPQRAEHHLRPGKHSVIAADWDTYLEFVERHTQAPAQDR